MWKSVKFTCNSLLILRLIKSFIMEQSKAIKPGPKPKKPDGTPDRRRRVAPETQLKHPSLKPHRHKPNE
jgi:hypothetical protein